jgi:hypothetical protein
MDEFSGNLVWWLCHLSPIQIVSFSFLQSVITTWRMLKFVRWNVGDAIALDTLRMREDGRICLSFPI